MNECVCGPGVAGAAAFAFVAGVGLSVWWFFKVYTR
jgi:hypothetical protein